MMFLEIDNVSKQFGGLLALNRVSFTMAKGEILGLIGPNGAGKTTLLNLINGFSTPTSGEIRFKGERINGLKPHSVCGLGIARTFQVVKPLSRMTVLENVTASAFSRTDESHLARKCALDALELTELERWRDTPAKSLPLSTQKRLELARAFATAPELILLDENFAGLNPSEVEETLSIIRKVHQSGVAMLIIEDNMRVVLSISDRIITMNCGEKIAEGAPQTYAQS